MNAVTRATRPSKEDTRNRILDKANELFRQYGFGKTTVSDIAEDLGMSPANIYKFFASKDALVEASAERNLSHIRVQVTAIAGSDAGVHERIEQIVLAIFRFHQDLFRNERQIYKMVIQAVEESWACVAEYHAFIFETFRDLLLQGQTSGEVKSGFAVSKENVTALVDALHAALHPHLRHDWSPSENDQRVRNHTQLVLSALR